MSESQFDPYLKWLGIRDKQRPPNHYRLLGLDIFESDPDVISSAADRQMSHLRRYQTGQHGTLSQKLLNEIAAAKLCLLDDSKRRAYDATIAKSNAPETPIQKRPNALAVALCLTTLLVIAILGKNYLFPAESPVQHGANAQPPIDSDLEPKEPEPDNKRPDNGGDHPEEAPNKVIAPKADSAPTLRLAKTNRNPWIKHTRPPEPPTEFDSELLKSLANRNLEQAWLELETYGKFASPAQYSQARTLTSHISTFWNAVDSSMEQLSPHDIFIYRGQEVQVGSAGQSLVLLAGDGSSCSFKTRRREMEAELAEALAILSMRETGLEQKRILRSFEDCDKRNKLRLAGLDITTQTNINQRPPLQLAPPEPRLETVKVSVPVPKPDVPPEKEIATLRAQIRRDYLSVSRSRSPVASIAIAKTLINDATPDTAPATQYALLTEAATLFAAAGDFDSAWNTTSEVERRFPVERCELRFQLLSDLARRPNADHHSNVRLSVSEFEAAVALNQFGIAEKLVRHIVGQSKKLKLTKIAQYYRPKISTIQKLSKKYSGIEKDIKSIENGTSDSQSYLRVGTFLVLSKGDFENGLGFLLKSKESELRRLAELEVTNGHDSPELADLWLALSRRFDGIEAVNAKRRAASHLVAATLTAKGSQLREIQSRLSRIAKEIPAEENVLTELLLANHWWIKWSNAGKWDRLSFMPNGKLSVQTTGLPWRSAKWTFVLNFIEIHGDDGKSFYRLKLKSPYQLEAWKYHKPSGKLDCTGSGSLAP